MVNDTAIIGGGAAGLSAAINCKRGGLDTVVIEKFPSGGGQLNLTDRIDNYPGIISADGVELARNMQKQAELLDVSFVSGEAVGISDGRVKEIRLSDGSSVKARTLIYAAGARHRKLGAKGEERLTGAGVSYCAVCDGAFYKNKTVAVVGGGDSAVKEALYLSAICSRVYVIHRRDEFRAESALVERMEQTPSVEIVRRGVVTEIVGEDHVEKLILTVSGSPREILCSGVFIAAGSEPDSAMLKGICRLEKGYVCAGEDCRTSAEGIFAAGDVRTKPLRQIVTACSDGANAAYSAKLYLGR